MRNAERRQRVDDRVDDGGCRADRARLAAALDAQRVDGRGRLDPVELPGRERIGLRHRVVHERGREALPEVVVGHVLPESLADPLGEPSVDLSLDEQRVDDAPAVLLRLVAVDDCGRVSNGLMTRPQASTATRRRRRTAPDSRSTSATAMCVPEGKVKFGGSHTVVASSPGSMDAGSALADQAAAATSASVAARSGTPRTTNRSRSTTMSSAPASRSAAAIRRALSSTLSTDATRAGAPTAMERLPNVPTPAATMAVAPWRTATSSIATPRRSATIWAKAVSSPWPCGLVPVSTVILPDVSTRTVALSQPGMGVVLDGPTPAVSMKVETPIPRWRPSSRARRWRSRKRL